MKPRLRYVAGMWLPASTYAVICFGSRLLYAFECELRKRNSPLQKGDQLFDVCEHTIWVLDSVLGALGVRPLFESQLSRIERIAKGDAS